MNKRVKKIIAAFLIVCTVAAYLVISNRDYFSGTQNFTSVSLDTVKLIHWEQNTDNSYISADDPQIVLYSLDSYIDYLVIDCEISAKTLSPKIYYSSSLHGLFAEDRASIPEYKYENGQLTIYLDRQVYNLRIDLTDESGMVFVPSDIRLYEPIAFQFDLITVMMWVFLVILLTMPMFLPKNLRIILESALESFSRYKHLLYNLIHKDIITKYRRSVLGIIWSVLNPLLMMLIITAVFEKIFRVAIENFPLYYLTGWLIFNFVSEATTTSMNSILESAALIRKVYVPKYIFPLEKCLSAFVNMLFSLIAVFIMYIFLQVRPPLTVFLIVIPMFYVLVFSTGLGMILATANVFFRDVQHLYSVWITAWMYLTPIIYPLEALPEWIVNIIKLNPLYYYVDYFRALALYGNVPGLQHNLICIFFSFAFLLAGTVIFKRNQDKFILYV